MTNVDPTNQTPPVETPPANSEAARNPDGSLKDAQTTVVEQKPTETKPTETPKPDDKKPSEGAPEKYADFKGVDDKPLDPKLVEAATPIFKDLGLNQEQAQKLVDFWNAQAQAQATAATARFDKVINDWRNEIINDKELGNGTDGFKPEVNAAIGKAIDALPNAAQVKSILNQTGAGNNREIARAFYFFSKFVTEGKPATGSGPTKPSQEAPSSGPKTAAQAMYPNLPST